MSVTQPFWVTAFLDLADGSFDPGTRFWARVTGCEPSPLRGDRDEFGTLLPPEGDPHLKIQRLDAGPTRVHLDLHVPDQQAAAAAAAALGARVVRPAEEGYVVLESPGGLTFCFVSEEAGQRTPPVTWSSGHRSLLDQVCLDVGADAFEAEVTFWAGLTGWQPSVSRTSLDFVPLQRPSEQPWRFLLQRTHDGRTRASAHLDLATDDRPAEVARLVSLGATTEQEHMRWTVMRDPGGTAYCVTDRDPATGLLAPAP